MSEILKHDRIFHQPHSLIFKHPTDNNNSNNNSLSVSNDNLFEALTSKKNQKKEITKYTDNGCLATSSEKTQTNTNTYLTSTKIIRLNVSEQKSNSKVKERYKEYLKQDLFMKNPIIQNIINKHQNTVSSQNSIPTKNNEVKEDNEMKISTYDDNDKLLKIFHENKTNQSKSSAVQTKNSPGLFKLKNQIRKKFQENKMDIINSTIYRNSYIQKPYFITHKKNVNSFSRNTFINYNNNSQYYKVQPCQNLFIHHISFSNKRQRPLTSRSIYSNNNIYLTNTTRKIKLHEEEKSNIPLKINKIEYNKVVDPSFDHHFLICNLQNNPHFSNKEIRRKALYSSRKPRANSLFI